MAVYPSFLLSDRLLRYIHSAHLTGGCGSRFLEMIGYSMDPQEAARYLEEREWDFEVCLLIL